jgi:DNA-binding CsgD family transcriptional regulator
MKKKKIRCVCGLPISPGQQARHELGRWHRAASEAHHLRSHGLSFADIARNLGLSRAYVSQKFGLIDLADKEVAS